MAAIRLDDKDDYIENTLSVALLDTRSGANTSKSITSDDLLSSSTWQGVPASKTLITPVQCKSLWRQFKAETEYTVTQAIAAQEASQRGNNWLPPLWAILALVVLGFNEFMSLLRNPLYHGVISVAFLLAKALWLQLNISGEFHHSILPGLHSLSVKFLPTVTNLLRRLAVEGQKLATTEPQRTRSVALVNFQGGVHNNADTAVHLR